LREVGNNWIKNMSDLDSSDFDTAQGLTSYCFSGLCTILCFCSYFFIWDIRNTWRANNNPIIHSSERCWSYLKTANIHPFVNSLLPIVKPHSEFLWGRFWEKSVRRCIAKSRLQTVINWYDQQFIASGRSDRVPVKEKCSSWSSWSLHESAFNTSFSGLKTAV
jgi:hypothetical protein